MHKLILLFFLTLAAGKSFCQDTIKVQPKNMSKNDSLGRPLNMYGDLLNDDSAYNHRAKWLKPASRIFLTNVVNSASSRYVFDYDWARISLKTWDYNLKHGFEWDTDGFGTNFIGHPHTGSTYFSVPRSNGYGYFASMAFAAGGSLMWEYFGENSRPSVNDIINTPISGALLGEIFYRLSSNVLDDRTHGRERVFREILAGIINPSRALNRLTQGKMFRVMPYEVYQKEPLNITFTAGYLRINNTGNNPKDPTLKQPAGNAVATMQLDYGNPFEAVRRKPFDLFRLRVELSYGKNTKLLGNVNGYGILAGRNIKEKRLTAGIFQHFDYWNNSLFQVGTIGFGGGLISRLPVAKKSNIYSNIHLLMVPLAGNSTRFYPDTLGLLRQYNFGGGLEAKVEETLNLNKWCTVGFTGFYYYIHTYVGIPGNSIVAIYKPNVAFRLFKNVSLGYEHFIYQNDRFLTGDLKSTIHARRSEDKVFLQIFLEDSKRRGMYH